MHLFLLEPLNPRQHAYRKRRFTNSLNTHHAGVKKLTPHLIPSPNAINRQQYNIIHAGEHTIHTVPTGNRGY